MPPLEPDFKESVIQDNRKDGYWVESILFHKDDRAPSIVASGLVSGRVELLENPIANPKGPKDMKLSEAGPWRSYLIAQFDSPVALCTVDVTGNGLMDVIICHDYGPFMLESKPHAGYITWLENPGRERLEEKWTEHYIGRWPAMHRVKVGHFTQKSTLEIVAASVVRGPHDKVTPIPIILYQSPDTRYIRKAIEWQRNIIDDENFTVIHEITPRKFNGINGLDSLLVASREGTTHLWYDAPTRAWKRELITIGEPRRPGQTLDSEAPGSGDHWGSGCVDAGRIGEDPFAYIATLDPFHGTTCCVLTKQNRGISGTVGGWKRQVLDVYGTPNQLKHTGDGPGHFIVCADFDGDGDDEFLLSLFGSMDRNVADGESILPDGGPNPNKGIMYYKCMDLEKGIWAKWKVSDTSSARVALGDFDAAGRIDLVSMKYNVERYYEEPNPQVTLHLNTFANIIPKVTPATITASLWNNEGVIYVSNPATEKLDPTITAAVPLIEIANYAVSIEVLPKEYKLDLPSGTSIKVLYGAVKDGEKWRAPLSVAQFTAASTVVNSPFILAHEKYGAVILRFKPLTAPHEVWKHTKDVPVRTTLDLKKYDLTLKPLSFTKVEKLWWGSTFPDTEFYNLRGFSFRFQDSQLQIANMQFWTAGKDVNCGVHNHSDAIFQEIHICLSPGTAESSRQGSMAKLKDEFVPDDPDPKILNSLGLDKFDLLPLGHMEEHGGMWYRDPYGLPVRDEASRVVKYPYHKWHSGPGDGIDVWVALEFGVDIDYRVSGIGQAEGSRKRVLPVKGLGSRQNKTCSYVRRGAEHLGCC